MLHLAGALFHALFVWSVISNNLAILGNVVDWATLSEAGNHLRGFGRKLMSDDYDEPATLSNVSPPYADNQRSIELLPPMEETKAGFGDDDDDPFSPYSPWLTSTQGPDTGDLPIIPLPKEFEWLAPIIASGGIALIIVLYILVCCCCIWDCAQPFVYYLSMTKERPWGQLGRNAQPGTEMSDFEEPKFSCFDDFGYCCVSTCFLPCRLADTVSIAGNNQGMMSYWIVLILYSCSGLVSYVFQYISPEFGSLIFWICQSLVFAKLRSMLRGGMGRRPTIDAEDFCFWCWCACCAVIQEAKEADKATGTRMECCGLCCPRLVLIPNQSNVVGAPALVAAPGVQPVNVTVNVATPATGQPEATAPSPYA